MSQVLLEFCFLIVITFVFYQQQFTIVLVYLVFFYYALQITLIHIDSFHFIMGYQKCLFIMV